MESMQAIREVMAWITALNLGILLFSTAVLAVAGAPIRRIHARMFDLSEGDLSRAYFQYLAQYKIAFLVLNLVPYLALHIVG